MTCRVLRIDEQLYGCEELPAGQPVLWLAAPGPQRCAHAGHRLFYIPFFPWNRHAFPINLIFEGSAAGRSARARQCCLHALIIVEIPRRCNRRGIREKTKNSRQYRIILSADAASEKCKLLSKKRR